MPAFPCIPVRSRTAATVAANARPLRIAREEPSNRPMQIVCPNCKTSYQLADQAIGANGRSVRCARCQTLWHPVPPAIPAPAVEEAAAVAAFRSELGAGPAATADSAVDMATAPPVP